MWNVVVAVGLTVSSGLCDAFGFVHASRVWKHGHFALHNAVVALSLFLLGALTYIFVIKYLDRLGVTSTEIQTLGWFATTVVGIAVIERSIFGWTLTDKAMLILAAFSVGWLVVRQG
jgi:hypothetical protein